MPSKLDSAPHSTPGDAPSGAPTAPALSTQARAAVADLELLGAAQGGDREALEQLLERHQARIYRFGMTMCRDPEDAEDILQETLLAMARGVRDFRGAASISTWLYTVARSFCIKKRRRSKFAPEERSLDTDTHSEVMALADTGRSPDELLIGKQTERALELAIDALEPAYREVLILRDVEGLTAPEVADVLGITPQAVKSRLHRARSAVRQGVAEALGAGDHGAPSEPQRREERPRQGEGAGQMSPQDAARGDALGVRGAQGAADTGSCPDVLSLLSQHLEGEISAEVCDAMERHLEGCPRCRDACDSLKRTLALCRTSGAELEVPPQVQAAVRRALAGFIQP